MGKYYITWHKGSSKSVDVITVRVVMRRRRKRRMMVMMMVTI